MDIFDLINQDAPFGKYKKNNKKLVEMLKDKSYLQWLKVNYRPWIESQLYQTLIEKKILLEDGITFHFPDEKKQKTIEKNSLMDSESELNRCFLCLQENIHLDKNFYALIPCGHTFCTNCKDTQYDKINALLVCPVCRQSLNLFHKIQKIFLQ